MKLRRLGLIIAAAALLLSLLALGGCNKVADEYSSDTFELGKAVILVA